MNKHGEFDGDTVLIEPDGASGLTITSFRAKVLSVVDGGWTRIDVNGCKKVLYDVERLVVHGSSDLGHWFDLAEDAPILGKSDPDDNLLGAWFIRVKRK